MNASPVNITGEQAAQILRPSSRPSRKIGDGIAQIFIYKDFLLAGGIESKTYSARSSSLEPTTGK